MAEQKQLRYENLKGIKRIGFKATVKIRYRIFTRMYMSHIVEMEIRIQTILEAE